MDTSPATIYEAGLKRIKRDSKSPKRRFFGRIKNMKLKTLLVPIFVTFVILISLVYFFNIFDFKVEISIASALIAAALLFISIFWLVLHRMIVRRRFFPALGLFIIGNILFNLLWLVSTFVIFKGKVEPIYYTWILPLFFTNTISFIDFLIFKIFKNLLEKFLFRTIRQKLLIVLGGIIFLFLAVIIVLWIIITRARPIY